MREIARLAGSAAPGARVGLRLVPPDREGRDRFGVPARMAPAAAALLARAGLPLTGLHIHLGAYQLGPLPPTGPPIHSVSVQYPVPVERFAAAATRLREVADRIGGIEWLDLGGGWPAAAGLGDYLAAVRRALGPDAPPIILEPGRALIRDAGWLLVRVVARRGPGRRGGRCRHHPGALRPVEALAGARRRSPTWRRAPDRPLRPALPAARRRRARGVAAARSRVGDLVWIGQTGAYAMAQASPFIHLRPGAVLLEGGRASTLRARETDDEALGAQAEPLLAGPEGRLVSAS